MNNKEKDNILSDGPASIIRKIKNSVNETNDNMKEKISHISNSFAAGINSVITIESPTSPKPKSGNFKTLPDKVKLNTTATKYEISDYRLAQFESLLQSDNVDLNLLRKLCWNGIPTKYRSQAWQILLGYMPTNKARRHSTITKKRIEYHEMIDTYYHINTNNTNTAIERTSQETEILRQILKDIPRTCPDSPFFQQEPIQRAMERILYLWSIRHPASGYVQVMFVSTCILFMYMLYMLYTIDVYTVFYK